MTVRHIVGLFLLAVMLVSHGGFAGTLPHSAVAHVHGDGGADHAMTAPAGLDHVQAAAPHAPPGEDLPSQHGQHSHAAFALPEYGSPLALVRAERMLPRPEEFPRLSGSDAGPLIHPPSA
jgi:hypothetical protein